MGGWPLHRVKGLLPSRAEELDASRGCRAGVEVSGQLAPVGRPCDNPREMRTRNLIIVMLLMFLIAAPVAMAADGCSGMGVACDAPCSAPCVSVSPSTGDAVLTPVAVLVPPEPPSIAAEALQVLDAPPKSPLLA